MTGLFLVRTKQNQIWGPLSKSQLAERVVQGELDPQDEICESGKYWIFLHEKEEIKKFLGVIPPDRKRSRSAEDEITETETETVVPEGTKTPITHAPSTQSPPRPVPYYEDSGYHLEQPSLYKFLLWLLLGCLALILYRVFLRVQ